MRKKFITLLSVVCISVCLHAQVLDSASEHIVELGGECKVLIYASADNSKWYYYLPLSLQLSTRNNKPEISFISYNSGTNPQVQGALLHLLITPGLNLQQEKTLEIFLKKNIDSAGVLIGPAILQQKQNAELEIISENPVAQILKRSLTNRVSGGFSADQKIALAFRFSEKDAEVVSGAFSSSVQSSGILFRIKYQYITSGNHEGIRTTSIRDAKMEGIFNTWTKQLTSVKNN